ncbi:hypothetical protein TRIP_B350214 [uncultured Desulfatiglans sp.]|uniref:Uncharacterized protein n=1 Tax=Uncultured Desulfatiglans sp. TaxID=1748965 RepID=A0A653AAM9_UNCDX|nr:hypothetical protein TRIP_B350214 [uncultured Desulfatiglans sp.]
MILVKNPHFRIGNRVLLGNHFHMDLGRYRKYHQASGFPPRKLSFCALRRIAF